jgi:ankyrin repeat protein
MSGNLNSDLMMASYEGNLLEVKRLLEAGADPNTTKDWHTPLTLTVTMAKDVNNSIEILKELLKYGADINKRAVFGGKEQHSLLERLVVYPLLGEDESSYKQYGKLIKFAIDNEKTLVSRNIIYVF